MGHAVRVYFASTDGSTDIRSYEASFTGVKWVWNTALPKGELKSVRRVEVYRPDEAAPCLALNTDGDKKNVVKSQGFSE